MKFNLSPWFQFQSLCTEKWNVILYWNNKCWRNGPWQDWRFLNIWGISDQMKVLHMFQISTPTRNSFMLIYFEYNVESKHIWLKTNKMLFSLVYFRSRVSLPESGNFFSEFFDLGIVLSFTVPYHISIDTRYVLLLVIEILREFYGVCSHLILFDIGILQIRVWIVCSCSSMTWFLYQYQILASYNIQTP